MYLCSDILQDGIKERSLSVLFGQYDSVQKLQYERGRSTHLRLSAVSQHISEPGVIGSMCS